MAYYDLYHNAPGWGTSGYHFATPPMPSYQPQPSWRGQDYYRAHGGFNDPYVLLFFENVRKYTATDVGFTGQCTTTRITEYANTPAPAWAWKRAAIGIDEHTEAW